MVSKIPWYSIGRFALIVLCLAIVLVLVVPVLPIYLDITAFKGPVEELLSEVAEAPVTVREIRLHPSLWPTLRVSGAEVAGSEEVDSPPFSRIERAEIKISLLPLLRKQLQLKRFLASDAIFYAHRPEGRGGNWPVSTTKAWEITELAGIDLENVTIHLEDHRTVRATMVIDHLTCDIAKSRPLDLELRGSLEGLPLSVSAGGPTLAAPLSQASDFPLTLQMELADLHLGLDGSASREPSGTKFQFSFDLQSAELAFLRDLGYKTLPQIGEIQLSGELSNGNAILEISDLEGLAGPTSVHGRLAFDRPDGKPSISGRLSLGQLDLGPWLESSNETGSDTEAPLPFSFLSATNADLKLSLKELTGLEIAMDDIALEVELANGVLSVPATLRAAGVPLSAQLDIRAQDVPEISSRVWARDLSLRQLDRIVDISDELDGRFGALDLAITSSGISIDALLANLLIEADATETVVAVMDETGEKPIEVFLDQAHATYRPGSPLAATARGALFNESFSLALRTASLSDLIDNDKWPLSLDLQGAGATVGMEGTLERQASGLGLDFAFELSGERLGDLEAWLGFPSEAGLTYGLKGHLTSATGTHSLRLDESFVGRTRFTGEFAWSHEDEPFIVEFHARDLDVRELQGLSQPVTNLDTEKKAIGIDLPTLPTRRTLHDAEIQLTVDRLFRDPVDLTDIEATLHIREGRLDRSPFSFSYDTQQFSGGLELDLREEIPRFTLEFRGDGKELGEILHREGIVENFTIVARELDLRIDASGASVREIIQSADLSGQLVDVRWQIHPAEFDEPLTIRLDRLDLSGPKGQPIVLTANGSLEQEPLDLRLVSRAPGSQDSDSGQTVPFKLTLGLAATKIELDGEAHLPISEGEFDIGMSVEGTTVASLSALMDMDLPDIGPYQLKSQLAVAEEGFALKELDLTLGESDLRGEIAYRRVEDRPTFTADLTSQLIRIEDLFQLEPEAEGEEQEEVADDPAAQKPPRTHKLTLEKIKGFDADITLAARKILTTDGSTDNMSFDLNLERGSLDLVVDRDLVSGEKAQLTAHVRPWGPGIQTEVRAAWDRQQYGWLADVLRPGTAMGTWSINLDLRSRGSSFQELAANLAGHVDLADYPVDVNATILDLWGAGLLNSLLPVFQVGSESQINCSVARFQVENGVLTSELFIIDSTRSRIRGKGTIDLPGNRLRLRLKPRPKQRNLINLSTPVKIQGPLTDPDAQISKAGLAVTFFRLSLWVYTVWRDLVRRPLPADGRDVCVDPFAAPQKQ